MRFYLSSFHPFLICLVSCLKVRVTITNNRSLSIFVVTANRCVLRKNFCLCFSPLFVQNVSTHDTFSFIFVFWIFLFADNLKANDLISCPNSIRNNNVTNSTSSSKIIQNNNNIDISNINDIKISNTSRSQLIQITSSSSLQITDLNDSTIKRLSKKTKNRSRYAKTNKKHCKKRRR